MNGAGNDFVMLDNRDRRIVLTDSQIARLCDRHRGIGADGLLMVEPAEGNADWRMRYYNADGAEVEMCGNGARCFARFAHRIAQSAANTVSFETPAGLISADLAGDSVSLAMSAPGPLAEGVELDAAGEKLVVYSINTGVPHAVVLVDDIEDVDLKKLGPALRHHHHFQPRGTNANFVRQLGPQDLAIRTYERGVEDETLACGTGVVASALTVAVLAGAESPIRVRVRGGDTLVVAFRRNADGFSDVVLTGPADFVFEGDIAV
ncbi:MAG: diaminopimelate epimerase [Chthoniobacterales bacterium]|nr:diaminopimelate epimerase [Chthoniobacterales bacterium]